MHDQIIAALVNEIAPLLCGRTLGKVWLLARTTLAFDFRLHDARYLLVAAEPGEPRLYLVRRTVRELERQSLPPDPFVLALRKHLGGATLLAVTKDTGDRIVRFNFNAPDAVGAAHQLVLVAQLTGRAANLFLLDEAGRIVAALRPPRGAGQEIGGPYQPPPAQSERAPQAPPPFVQGAAATLSDAADDYYRAREAARTFAARAGALAARLRQEITRREKLQHNLDRDLTAHGDADEHKRIGDLLLANIGTHVREGARVRVTDYYAEGTPTVELELDEHTTLQAEAARRFARYTKAKRGAQEISERLAALQTEIAALNATRAELERINDTRDAAALDALAARLDKRGGRRGRAPQQAQPSKPGARGAGKEAGKNEQDKLARRYLSSDGYEMLVGRAARDNDQLTFRVARPHDLWLHAADYPGSHVIVRNPRRTEIPHRTLVEAAQLAANYSQAKRDAKVAVNYTQRKFVAKPKGAAPGLVRMANFRTMLVEPRESGERV
ncbi:MAG TPA: NFACT family protein [Pyrinomonadaceae bacterium]|jgi:predicted ribosome quality control (RQC) complex YloA/Tae2 family protein